jgi:hypothetical protein
MGSVRAFNPVKLFAGVLVSDSNLISEVEKRLTETYGPIDHRSKVLQFDFTGYYSREMGDVINRIFFSFERLIEADRLAEIKRQTNRMEDEMKPMLETVKRPINLDPGYVEQAKVILASTKNFYHRIFLGQGIFGEVTMHFKNNSFQYFPWTYPDYKSREYQEFFLKIRQIYRAQLKTICILSQEKESNE